MEFLGKFGVINNAFFVMLNEAKSRHPIIKSEKPYCKEIPRLRTLRVLRSE
ncbi:MAG: hypothetical protein LBP96_03370 [Bacteroidales bacterium]|jgi:hypothetical protein|nr:hypothetical protein [Bacteroidales bacterium]